MMLEDYNIIKIWLTEAMAKAGQRLSTLNIDWPAKGSFSIALFNRLLWVTLLDRFDFKSDQVNDKTIIQPYFSL